MIIINHASINADSSIFFSLLQTLSACDLAVPLLIVRFFASLAVA